MLTCFKVLLGMLITDFLASTLMIFAISSLFLWDTFSRRYLASCLGLLIRNKYEIYGSMGNGSSENVTETLSLYEYKMEMFPN